MNHESRILRIEIADIFIDRPRKQFSICEWLYSALQRTPMFIWKVVRVREEQESAEEPLKEREETREDPGLSLDKDEFDIKDRLPKQPSTYDHYELTKVINPEYVSILNRALMMHCNWANELAKELELEIPKREPKPPGQQSEIGH